jgi:hypothetical protein
MRRKMMKTKSLSKPTAVFAKKPKKPEPDDMPGKIHGGKVKKRLMGKKL